MADAPTDGYDEEDETLLDGPAAPEPGDEDIDDDDPQTLSEAPNTEFYRNLADSIDQSVLDTIASRLLSLISLDKEARSKRDKQYEEGLQRTGLGKDAPGGAQFEGASRVVHPLLVEACVDFASRAIKELLPSSGPVKTFIPGDMTAAKLAKAKRKATLLNWQLTVQATEFRAELEQLLTQVPLGGAQYLKINWDEARNRPTFLFVGIDEMYLPFAASNFYSAQRKTHAQQITQFELTRRVESGMYRDLGDVPSGQTPEPTAASAANDKIEGRTDTSMNEDGLRIVYEIHTFADLESSGADGEGDAPGERPYIISIDDSSKKVLSVYRNWEEDDESAEEMQWFVEFPFVPWRGAYPVGLPHLIGGLSAALTGALRALLDAAHISNSQTMLKLKGGIGGQSLTIQPTQVEEIEGGLNVDDVRKIAMPLPFPPPSPVLFQLLGFLTDAGRGVVRTALDDIADGNATAPVGTTLAKIEQGMVVFSAIHARLHDAMARVLRVLHRLNATYLDDEKTENEAGEELASRGDFVGPLDVVPVSDPNIFSEAQRFAQVQAVAQRAAALPQMYNARKVEERILETLRIPNATDLLNPAVEPKEQNAINENVAATMGRPIVAFPNQDHIAHLKSHLPYMMSPILGSSQIMAPTLLPAMINHIRDHVALWYASSVFDLCNETTGVDIGEEMKGNKTSETRQAFDRMLGEASLAVTSAASAVFAPLPAVVAQSIQMLQSLTPPPQPDPSIGVAMAETQRRSKADDTKAAIDQQRLALQAQDSGIERQSDAQMLQLKTQLDRSKLELDAARLELERLREANRVKADAANVAARQAMNADDNLTALTLADLEVASGEKFSVSTGTGINP